jgi:glutathione synthase/RimK-type ligase-like ATP-grasp enzyme
MLTRVFRRFFFIFTVIKKTNWVRIYKKYNRKSKNIVWFFPSFPNNLFGFLFSASFENDFALLNAVSENMSDFKILIGRKGILKERNVVVFYNLSRLFAKKDYQNYTQDLNTALVELTNLGHRLVPRLADTIYWENKNFMHDQFTKLEISHPHTIILKNSDFDINQNKIEYPILLKLVHGSGSTGMKLINNNVDLKSVLNLESSLNAYFIQSKVNMTKDLRVIFIGNKIVLHYWRINTGNEWRPTSTGHGSLVNFDDFPIRWESFLLEQFKRLNLITGAFDVVWENDDLNTTPLILEVSPSYMPNPRPMEKHLKKPYEEYKKTFIGKGNYLDKYVDIVFELKDLLIKEYIKNEN